MMRKLLVADVEPDILTALTEIFKHYGFEVCSVDNADDFKRLVFAQNPDLIILDIVFGDQSGPDVYDRVMKNAATGKIPVIFLSGLIEKRSESPIVKGRQVAMYAKPLNIAKLVADIRAAFADSILAQNVS